MKVRKLCSSSMLMLHVRADVAQVYDEIMISYKKSQVDNPKLRSGKRTRIIVDQMHQYYAQEQGEIPLEVQQCDFKHLLSDMVSNHTPNL